MEIIDRFIKYISIPTNSNSKTCKHPSSDSQRLLAEALVKELNEIRMSEVYYDKEHCYVYALLKGQENAPKIGFIAHMDTSEAVTDINITPQIIENYDGNSVKLSENEKLDIDKYIDLKSHKGKTLITTDGTTLLGADDKAGISEIMTMLEILVENKIEHSDIYVAFTPDEEIGKGTTFFDFSKFKADFAYTVDGSDLGEISYENFNAASIEIEIDGISTHLGSAKNTLVNSQLIAIELINKIPKNFPENTEGYEGYYHLDSIEGNITKTCLKILIRDFDKDNFQNRKEEVKQIVDYLNVKYNNCIKIDIKDSYYNMKEIISKNMHIVENVKTAMKNIGVKPIIQPIRGGTDGAILTYKGLPCPNLGTGGHNFHGIYEYICLEDMQKTVEILLQIVKLTCKIHENMVT